MYICIYTEGKKNRQAFESFTWRISLTPFFFFFWGDLGALVGTLVVFFLWVTGHHLGTYIKIGIATLRR